MVCSFAGNGKLKNGKSGETKIAELNAKNCTGKEVRSEKSGVRMAIF
jgi:hypothetical protein